jgi:hypothetical protein
MICDPPITSGRFRYITPRRIPAVSTAIGLGKYRIPSDLRSQVKYRPVSTTVGDHVGILGAVVFAPIPKERSRDVFWLESVWARTGLIATFRRHEAFRARQGETPPVHGPILALIIIRDQRPTTPPVHGSRLEITPSAQACQLPRSVNRGWTSHDGPSLDHAITHTQHPSPLSTQVQAKVPRSMEYLRGPKTQICRTRA